MWARRIMRIAGGVIVLLVVALLAAWLWFRAEAKSWAWWTPPAMLTIGGRHFDRDASNAVTLAEAKSLGAGTWRKVQIEWPMQWPVWASEYRGISPTVVYLCRSDAYCQSYDLQGGP